LIECVNLQAAIDQLPEGYREIFILYDVHGYEHNEIAQITGRSIENLKSQLHKARKRSRELLQGMPNLRAARSRKTPGCSLALAADY
jgi:RNA polymerase sigma-70 factor, ECF subfamily